MIVTFLNLGVFSMSNLKGSLYLMIVTMSRLCAEEISEVRLSIEDNLLVHVQPEDTFSEVVGMIHRALAYQGQENDFRIDFAVSGSVVTARAVQVVNGLREYSAGVSAEQQEDIRFILKTLANSSILKIGASETNLKKAGDRIDYVHPLRFLEFVFTDEELKVCMHNLQGRNWVWKEFVSGIIGSFNEEHSKGNIKPDQIANFIKTLNISPSVVNPSIQNQRWTELIETLIAKIPRDKGSDRYNM